MSINPITLKDGGLYENRADAIKRLPEGLTKLTMAISQTWEEFSENKLPPDVAYKQLNSSIDKLYSYYSSLKESFKGHESEQFYKQNVKRIRNLFDSIVYTKSDVLIEEIDSLKTSNEWKKCKAGNREQKNLAHLIRRVNSLLTNIRTLEKFLSKDKHFVERNKEIELHDKILSSDAYRLRNYRPTITRAKKVKNALNNGFWKIAHSIQRKFS